MSHIGSTSSNLITTHNATYIHPRLMPGYRGYCPGEKYDYGQTYGAFTSKQLQDYRSTVLQSSFTPYKDGGNFPTFYSHNPEIVLNKTTKEREKYCDRYNCDLFNMDYKRSEEIRKFDLLAQKHREHYKDRTGTLKPVKEFHKPTSNMEFVKEKYLF